MMPILSLKYCFTSVSYTHLEVKEGDVLREEEGRFFLDSEETDKRRREMKKKLMDLFE